MRFIILKNLLIPWHATLVVTLILKHSKCVIVGGGGLLTDDLMEIRIKGAMPRMQALKEVEKTDAVNCTLV
jgi:hypothetical protein